MNWTLEWIKSKEGMAIDEAILVTTMVGSLGVMGAVTVSWDSVYTNTFENHKNLVTEMQAIESANVEFFDRYKVWPHATTNGDWSRNVAALADKSAMRYPYNSISGYSNVMKDLKIVGKERKVIHEFGDGGRVMQHVVDGRDGQYMEIIFENVPLKMAKKADEMIDGMYSPTEGRISLVVNDSKDQINLHYLANKI